MRIGVRAVQCSSGTTAEVGTGSELFASRFHSEAERSTGAEGVSISGGTTGHIGSGLRGSVAFSGLNQTRSTNKFDTISPMVNHFHVGERRADARPAANRIASRFAAAGFNFAKVSIT